VNKYIYDFNIYCIKYFNPQRTPSTPCSQRGLTHNVVMGFIEGLENKGHVVVMDNYFSSIGLIRKVASKGIYATMGANRTGLSQGLKDLKACNESEK
jgi:hypothetical protein